MFACFYLPNELRVRNGNGFIPLPAPLFQYAFNIKASDPTSATEHIEIPASHQKCPALVVMKRALTAFYIFRFLHQLSVDYQILLYFNFRSPFKFKCHLKSNVSQCLTNEKPWPSRITLVHGLISGHYPWQINFNSKLILLLNRKNNEKFK